MVNSPAALEPSPTLDPPSAPPASRVRQLVLLTAKVVVSGGLLALLFSRVDVARLWASAKEASLAWLLASLALYGLMVLLSAWRWELLLRAQRVLVPLKSLVSSFLVATFFNNFLPSNIGGDVIRIRDTAKPAGSKTLATTVILLDRGFGLLALVFVAAAGATLASLSGGPGVPAPLKPSLLWLGLGVGAGAAFVAISFPGTVHRLLSPLRLVHAEWVDERLARISTALARFRDDPAALAGGILGALAVQLVLVAFYGAIARGLAIPLSFWHLAVIVPVSFLVQMLPISMNGFGVREATFVFYFSRLGLPLEGALLLSLLGAALIMLFSLSGAVVYVTRGA